MSFRLVLLSLTGALLYIGPFLAGLAGASIALLPVFAAIFVIWVALMRPAVWAKATQSGTPLGLAIYLSGLTVIQLLLVVVCFALGRGLSVLIGDVVALPLWLPPALSLAALPLGRLIANPGSDLSETEALLDEAEAAQGDGRDAD